EVPPRGERRLTLVHARVALPAQPGERPQVLFDARGLRGHLDEIANRSPELPAGDGDAVGLEDPGLALHDLAESPEGHAPRERRGAAVAPEGQLGPRLDAKEELEHEPGLPDAGVAGERHEMRRAVRPDVVERLEEELDRGAPVDERPA